MVNRFSITRNRVNIYAPGSSCSNRIKNDLLWDINKQLEEKYHLFSLHITKHVMQGDDVIACISAKGLVPRYLVLKKLDRMFTEKVSIEDSEAMMLHADIDPKMDYEVFKESCCVENVDLEYIAISEDTFISDLKMNQGSISKMKSFIKANVPAYISYFGNKEITMLFNDVQMQSAILSIVGKYCTR